LSSKSITARELFKEFPDARIMVITAKRGSDILECLKMGAVSYAEKPLRWDDIKCVTEFTDALKAALDKKAS